MFGTLKGLLRRRLEVQTPPQKVFGRLGFIVISPLAKQPNRFHQNTGNKINLKDFLDLHHWRKTINFDLRREPRVFFNTVDGRNPANQSIVYPMIYRILAPSQVVGLGISEPSTVSFEIVQAPINKQVIQRSDIPKLPGFRFLSSNTSH